MIKGRVLLATDFSRTAEKLTKSLTELKEIGVSEVLLINVVDIRHEGINASQLIEYNEKRLEEVKKGIEELGLEVETRVPIGFAADEIVKLAKSEDISLILIASHGEGIIKKIFLGSTTHNVIRRSPVPVLIEKFKNVKSGDFELVCKRKFDKIMVPTDFSECADEVLDMVVKMHTPARKIILVSIIESSNDLEELEERKKESREKLEEIKEQLKEHQVDCELSVKIGEGVASSNIIRIAKDEEVGIIIMGTRGKGFIKDLLLGSTADRVAQRSPIPVLLVPCKKK